MNRLSILIQLIFSCFVCALQAYEIRDCHSVDDVFIEIERSNPSPYDPFLKDLDGRTSTLVVFDIDNTIFRASKMIGTDEWFRHTLSAAYENNPDNKFLAKQRVIELWHAIQTITPIIPIEGEKTPLAVQRAQNLVTTMALTTRGSAISATTIYQLASLGIDFSSPSLSWPDRLVPHVHDAYFIHGVLFTNAHNKGNALLGFLKAMNYYPKKIIFLNDKQDHIEEMIHIEQVLGADLIGLRYAKADHYMDSFSHAMAEEEFLRFVSVLHDLEDDDEDERVE